MSIASINLRVPRRGSDAAERKGRRYSKQFQVIVNDILDGPDTILRAFGDPTAEYDNPLARDAMGVPAVNSASDWFDPPYEIVRPRVLEWSVPLSRKINQR